MLDDVTIALARINLLAFVKATFPEYSIGWVHREICARLMRFFVQVQKKQSPRLILTMPPRHGKSQLVSKHFPAWAFGVNPNINFIVASYSDDLVRRINKDVQRIMTSEEYLQIFPNTNLLYAKGSVRAVKTTGLFEIPRYKGSFRSTGIGGALTGMGGDILAVDDPFKGRAEADSPTIRNNVWDWYTSVLYTRQAQGAGILVTVTRWHEDDLVGRLLKAQNDGGDKWELINYPAIAETDEPHRKEGEALHPERYSIETLESIKRNIGAYDWGSLYQQHPSPRAGGIFRRDWLRFYDELPPFFELQIQSWDFTFKDAATSDNVSGQVWGKLGNDFYLLDNVTEKMDFVTQQRAIQRISSKWDKTYIKVVEDKANGSAIINSMGATIPGLTPFNPRSSKTERAYSVSPLFETGRVFIPNRNKFQWVDKYVDELCNFPAAPHDDQVDSTTQALMYFTQRKSGIINFL